MSSSSSSPGKLRLHFDHGLGDCAHFAAVLRVYQRHGYDIECHYETNKAEIFQAIDVPFTNLAGTRYHKWAYFHDFNQPTPDDDRSGNKVAANLGKAPLPDIGDYWEAVNREYDNLAGTLEKLLTPEIEAEADKFLANLPAKIVILHTNGSNLQAAKNLPHEDIGKLYRLLLSREDVGLILADWDLRIPECPHARVRHVKRDLGHIDLLRYYALLRRSSLVIGIDSGVFHFTAFSDVPALYLGHHHYPSCVCLKRSNNVYMTRNAESYRVVNEPRRKQGWNLVEYGGTYPPPEEITKHAFRILDGPRYGLKTGQDVMMRELIDRCKGSTSTSPVADRNVTFDWLFREINQRFTAPVILETGCVRSPEDWAGAGNSTYLFSLFMQGRSGSFTSVDNNAAHLDFCKRYCFPGVDYVCRDSVSYLRECKRSLDVVYLDSLDCEDPYHAEHGLQEVQAVAKNLHDRSIVAVDDTVWHSGSWVGKGRLAVPWLLSQGWGVACSGYGVMLTRTRR